MADSSRATHSRRRFRQRDLDARDDAALPAAIRRRQPADTADTDELWRRYKREDDAAAYRALCEHYAPIGYVVPRRLKRRNPDRYWQPLGDLVSAGLMAVVTGVRTILYPSPRAPFNYLFQAAVYAVHRETTALRWCGPETSNKIALANRIRADLTQEHCRVPTPEEVGERLAGLITNANFYVDDRPRQMRGGADSIVRADPAAPSPDAETLQAELRELLARDLKPDDRKILRMLLRGLRAVEIARELGITKQAASFRVNGLLWTLRSNAKVAAYVGVEPDARKVRRNPPTVRHVPPARLAV